MARRVALGKQDFEDVITSGCFYVDKTDFIREWWEQGDSVTLITRPRRFGKTLNMSMLNYFFSNQHKEKKELFDGLSISKNEKIMALQGTYPVISLTFANVKGENYESSIYTISRIFSNLYIDCNFLLEGNILDDAEKEYFINVKFGRDSALLGDAVFNLSRYLSRYYGKNVIILLDEYDTPVQEAYLGGYWDEMVSFMRCFFNAAFKTNSYLYRGVLTGITRISKESMFSDLNNINVVTTTSNEYAAVFGFTEEEVFKALAEQGMGEAKNDVKKWYDGFKIGDISDIYNPWSILNFLSKKKLDAYWVHTSSNNLVGKLIQEGEPVIKRDLEMLLRGEVLDYIIDEQVVFGQLQKNSAAVWSLLLASGYLKAVYVKQDKFNWKYHYGLAITNLETFIMFQDIVRQWFHTYNNRCYYDGFIDAFLKGNLEEMNVYMNKISLVTFSSFDTGNAPSEISEPERFYHGFVLGLLVTLQDEYILTSNRESGLGRYDVVLEPRDAGKDAYILEFKVMDSKREKSLKETVERALEQIEEKRYDEGLLERGIQSDRIWHYGFGFQGKQVLIDGGRGRQSLCAKH